MTPNEAYKIIRLTNAVSGKQILSWRPFSQNTILFETPTGRIVARVDTAAKVVRLYRAEQSSELTEVYQPAGTRKIPLETAN